MNEVKELVEELRNKKSRDNRELLDRSADTIEELAKELCKKHCHHLCHDTKDCVVEDEAREYLHSALTNEGKVSAKDKLLLINENKSNNFDVKSNEELFKQALVEGVNNRIDKDIEKSKKIEQIEEMAFILGDACAGVPHKVCETTPCNHCRAQALYNAGYRKHTDRFLLKENGEFIPLLPKQSEWISVEDSLPDCDGDFLLWNDYYGAIVGHYFARGKYFISKAVTVTHWMPLPEAPKMKGGEQDA